MRYLTSDLHLGDNRFTLLNRPFQSVPEMENTIISNFNRIIAPTDELYILGDVCKEPSSLERIKEINGIKTLFRGNHDRQYNNETLLKYFVRVVPEGEGEIFAEINGIKFYITHYPSMVNRKCFGLVGHIHSVWRYQLNMFNVGVDVNHFLPIPETALENIYKSIEYYDDDAWIAYRAINKKYYHKRGKLGTYYP